VASTSLVQRKGLKRRPFLCTPSRLETLELCRARQGILITTGGAKCEYRGGAKSSCQTHGSDGPKNIWFEPHAGNFGSFVKDKVELLLWRKVCVNKTMTLNQAKAAYLKGWTGLLPQK
jgi:hypothetical protein